MSEKNQIVVVLIVALFRGVSRPEHGAEDSRWGRSAVVTAEPANGLRVYPEAVLVRTETAFGSGVPRRRNDFQGLLG